MTGIRAAGAGAVRIGPGAKRSASLAPASDRPGPNGVQPGGPTRAGAAVLGSARSFPRPRPMLQRRLQHDRTGCGLACVAMLAGIGYAQARTLARALAIGPRARPAGAGPRSAGEGWRTDARQLRRMLAVLRIGSGAERRVGAWRECDGDGLVAINARADGTWHWVVYLHDAHAPCVLDPNPRVRRDRRRDFGRMRPSRYVPVDLARAPVAGRGTGGPP